MSERTALLVVGGGPAGLAAARAYREADGAGRVLVVTPEATAAYLRPSLSKEFLRGEAAADDLPLEPPDFYAEARIDVQTGDAAVLIEPSEHTVVLQGGERVTYEHCVLATGAHAAGLPVPGAEHDDLLTLRSLADAERLRERASGAASAVVVGSGFVGCEIAASLAARGLAVTMISDETIPHATRLGPEAGERIATWLRDAGVTLHLGTGVARFERGTIAHHDEPVGGDLVVVAAGMHPDAQLASVSGLDAKDGRVVVDAGMRSSADGVLAAGDVALAYNASAGRHLAVEHWGDALAMGAVAGRTAAGVSAEWDEVPGFWSSIGSHTLKYAAWGDGFDRSHPVDHGDGAFTVWYERDGTLVGVLAHERDEDYEQGREQIAAGAAWDGAAVGGERGA